MDNTLYFKKKQHELESLISQLELRLSNQIEGILRVSSAHGYNKYYLRRRVEPEGVLKQQYLGKRDMEIVRQLAQQEYEKQLLAVARSLLHKVTEKAEVYDDHPLQMVYESLHSAQSTCDSFGNQR